MTFIFMYILNVIIFSGRKYIIRSRPKSYITKVTLTIKNIISNDYGTYLCVAKNSLGESDGTIKLSGTFLLRAIRGKIKLNQIYCLINS